MSLPLLKPSLYRAETNGEPVLLGGRCVCGYTFFPMQSYGCERCGGVGEALTAQPLSGRGRLVAFATVHAHADARRSAPFVIGTIALDDGPFVRTLIDEPPLALRSAARLRAVLSPVKTEQGEALDLRFKLEQEGGAV